MGKIKSPKPQGGNRLAAPASGGAPPMLGYPVFCLKNLRAGHDVEDMEDDDKVALVRRLRHLSQMTWAQVTMAPRHGAGLEKIARTSIRPAIPTCVTEDISLVALRFNGMKPMVGWRSGDIFHIVWLDHSFDVYPH